MNNASTEQKAGEGTANVIRFGLMGLLTLLSACSGPVAEVRPLDVALTATVTQGQAPLRVQFVTQVSGSGGGAVAYTWVVAGKTFEGGPNRSFTFRQPGEYEVVVEVTRADATKTARAPVSVAAPASSQSGNAVPTVTLSSSPVGGQAPLKVTFRAAAEDTDGDPLLYTWDFGNGQTADTGVQQTRTYRDPGLYVASVTVTDGRGGVASSEVVLNVAAAPAGQPVLPETPTGGPSLAVVPSPGGPVPWTVTYRLEPSGFEGTPAFVYSCEGGVEGDEVATPTETRIVCHHTEVGQGLSVTAVDDAAHYAKARGAAELAAATAGVPYYGLWNLSYQDPATGVMATLPVRISTPGGRGRYSGLDPQTGVEIYVTEDGGAVGVNGLVADELVPSDEGKQIFQDDLNLRLEKVSNTF